MMYSISFLVDQLLNLNEISLSAYIFSLMKTQEIISVIK